MASDTGSATRRLFRKDRRVLIYSHDTMGLGHLRRCRAIAHAMVQADKDLSVLILSGSPIIGSFDFKARVDFVRIPGVIKLRNGEYTSLNLHIDIAQTLSIRGSIIRHTAEAFDPDLFLVDKEPLGLRGEVSETLHFLKRRGYDDIWIYGLPQICDPLAGLAIPQSVRRKISYTGYLHRMMPQGNPRSTVEMAEAREQPYVLVTTGGGGDGDALIDWVLRAYESGAALPHRALLVLGPFMQSEKQSEFLERAARLSSRVEAITFDAHLEQLITRAAGIVAMGGYNTFCEILSFDKPAVIVPRVAPRLEQFIRAERAESVGLTRMLPDDGVRDAEAMVAALRALAHQAPPSAAVIPGLLDGLENIERLMARWLPRPASNALAPLPVAGKLEAPI